MSEADTPKISRLRARLSGSNGRAAPPAPYPDGVQSDWAPGRSLDSSAGDWPDPDDAVVIDDPWVESGSVSEEYWEDVWYDSDPDDWEKLPRRSGFLRRAIIVGLVMVLLGGTAVVFASSWLGSRLDPPGSEGDDLVIEIPQGASTNDIATILEREDVVADSTVFRYYLRWKGAGDFQAGVYNFNENMAVWDAREVLEAGPVPPDITFVTAVEGLRLTELRDTLLDQIPEFDRVELEAALTADDLRSLYQPENVTSKEGFLFPETYQLDDQTRDDERGLVRRMLDQFDIVAADLGLGDAEDRVGYTPYEVVTIASLIEEEAKIDDDRAKIARVIYNRLEVGELLGIDATVIYAVNKPPGQPLLQSDLENPSPYNTRVNPGLPPTPISAPSRKSLEAALNPADGDWFWYVLTNEGGVEGAHTFATTQAEFDAAVAVCIERDLGCG